MDEIHKDISEIKADFRMLRDALSKIEIAMARSEERQSESAKKIDLLTIALQNNYINAVEYGSDKRSLQDRLAKLESWNTWIVRLVIGAVVLAGLAALRIKGGI